MPTRRRRPVKGNFLTQGSPVVRGASLESDIGGFRDAEDRRSVPLDADRGIRPPGASARGAPRATAPHPAPGEPDGGSHQGSPAPLARGGDVSNLDLPFGPDEADFDAYLREIDDALDACFLADMD